ncbi:MAG: ABC transporter permease [Caldilineaceae bacterium]|nr:ABC transporter permease [Caldilineaceae bacterium]MXZ23889.1 ABC transporter permease [Caldilineaceae bacterium SB0665_bin_21]MXZ41105.1 ABC transporter permease [Caldilineaceae bacterium SB0666_bin_21]MYA03259.1 ABC transporter permease [Caldilineaceae bacterium SB0664_bin_22]MYC63224.1 ABC transporter permease [Caldilineaceae bacterium SB0661_bin_34]
MLAFIARRLVYMISTLVLISFVGFLIINLPPGSYIDVFQAQRQLQGTHTAEAELEALKRRYGLDKPVPVQYWIWVRGFVRGDFGRSFEFNREVSELIWERLGFTVAIATGSLLFIWLVAIPIGIYTATHQYKLGDNVATIVGMAGLSIPDFMLALVLMVVIQRLFGFTVGGLFSREYVDAPWSLAKVIDLVKHLWVPIVVVGTSGTAGLMRIMRGNLLDILNMQYVQAARARGLREATVVVKHAVRNAIHPLIMLLGMSLPTIISGSLIVSIVLGLPTTGPLYFNALRQQDMYLAGTFLMFLAFMLVLGNFLADILLGLIDPRIRYE